MSDTAFVDAMLTPVLQATPTPFPERVRHRLELQAQYDALELANLLEARGPSRWWNSTTSWGSDEPTRPARLLALLRQEHTYRAECRPLPGHSRGPGP